MNARYIETLRQVLPSKGVQLAPALTEAEIAAIEEDFGFVFPPDLRMLIGAFVPRGDDFPDWHTPHAQDSSSGWTCRPTGSNSTSRRTASG